MKLVKEYINEKFTDESDPIQDIGIGSVALLKQYIQKLLEIDLKRGYTTVKSRSTDKPVIVNSIMYIHIEYEGGFTVQFYSNKLFKNHKRIYKRDYVIELLKESNLYDFLSTKSVENNTIGQHHEKYDFNFPVKSKYTVYFGKIAGTYESQHEKNNRVVP